MFSKKLSLVIMTIPILSVFLCTAQITGRGKCKSFSTIEPFDFQAYAGVWYEIEKYPTNFETGGKCVYIVYTDNRNGSMQVRNVFVSNETSEFTEVIGTARRIDSVQNDGKLSIRYPTVSDVESPYFVLSTDYDYYSIVWSCTEREQDNVQFLWYLSRELNPEDGERKSARDIMNIFGLNTTNLVATDQSRCISPFAII